MATLRSLRRVAAAAAGTAVLGGALLQCSASEKAPGRGTTPKAPGSLAELRWLRPEVPSRAVATDGLLGEVALGPQPRTLTHNSVVLVRDLLSAEECRLFADAAEAACGPVPEPLERVRVADLPPECQALSDRLLRERVLPLLEARLPEPARELFGRSSGLGDCRISFSDLEPAVNRYVEGGEFEAHVDGYSLTLNVMLSDGGFEGGGTEFWKEEASMNSQRPVVRVLPRQGVGTLFSGTVRHAGHPVRSGVRYLYVASFDLDPPESQSLLT